MATDQRAEWQFDILLADGFVLTELAAIADVLTIANRVCPDEPFSWTYRSLKGGSVTSSTGASVWTRRLPDRPAADYLIVTGNADADHPALSLPRTLPVYLHRGARVFLLSEAAARYILEQRGAAASHVAHWENLVLLRERTGDFEASFALAAEKGPVVTCAGMGATVDILLTEIGRHVSGAARTTVANILLHDRIRDFGAPQPYSGMSSTGTGDARLDDCIRLMEANIEEPLPIRQIVGMLGISTRSLERRFRTYLGTTPNTFYRELRLGRANSLLRSTSLSVREIGLACGFPSGFSSLYKSLYGVTPQATRSQRRLAAQ